MPYKPGLGYHRGGDTQKAAARSVKQTRVADMKRRIMKALGSAGTAGLTCEEVAVDIDIGLDDFKAQMDVRRRLSDLRNEGKARHSSMRRNLRNGNTAIVWLRVTTL